MKNPEGSLNSPTENNKYKKKLSKMESFKKVPVKLKQIWSALTLRYKVALGFFLIVMPVVIILTLLYTVSIRSGKIQAPFTPKETVVEFGDWKRLAIPQRQKPFFKLSQAKISKYGILPQEALVLKTEKPVSQAFIEQNLITSAPVNVKTINTNEYHIVPREPLPLSQTINIKMETENEKAAGITLDRNYSWTFQTQEKFHITSSIPGDKKNNVPVNTGIEIVFSQNGYNDPAPFISISPAIKYRLEEHNETLAIIPLEPLEPKTVYSVTLKKGLNLKDRNDPINQDYIFTFQTKEIETKESYFYLNDDFQQATPFEPLIVKVYTREWEDKKKIKTEVFKFTSSADFIASRKKIDEANSKWMTYYPDKNEDSTKNLQQVMKAELIVQKKESLEYLQLPDELSEGLYLVTFRTENEDSPQQLWVQSTTLSGYVSVAKEKTLIWANIADSGPVNNAAISISGTSTSSTTNERGIAIIDTPVELFSDTRHYIEITSDQKRLVLPVDSLSEEVPPGKETNSDYWSYLYHEKNKYKPNDTVYFFGVIKKRDTNKPPTEIDINLSTDLKQKITPNDDGTFIGNFKLENFSPGWHTLNISANNTIITETNIVVEEYTKPEINIEVISDKKAVFANETVNMRVTAKFFDGTPASKLPLKIFDGEPTEVSTDQNGIINHTYTASYITSNDMYPPENGYQSVTFSPKTARSDIIEGQGIVYVFQNKLMITTKSSQEENKAKLKATINRIDLSKFNKNINTTDVKGDLVKGQQVQLKTAKSWYEMKENGTYYDFLEKTTKKKYEYIRHEEQVEERKLTTNENGQIEYEFILEEGKSYNTTVQVTDEDNHTTGSTESFYYSKGTADFWEKNNDSPVLILDSKESAFSIGNEVRLNIHLGEKPYPDNDNNKFLFISAQNGKQEAVVNDSPAYQFKFEQKHIPNLNVGSVIFTGKHYIVVNTPCRWQWSCYYDMYSFRGIDIQYQKEDSKLMLTINSDAPSYKPGEKAKITVLVSKDKQPVKNARVNITAVDAALVAMGIAVPPEILPSLYAPIPVMVYYNYYSHRPVLADEPSAEMGGGGGEYRSLFKDTAIFENAVTDEDGKAVFETTVPDNLTTWVIYAQAVNEELKAGQNESSIVVSKEFFVTANFPKEYLKDENPELTGNSFGNILKNDSLVNFTFSILKDEKEIKKENKSSLSNRPVYFSFPGLDTGRYEAQIRGTAQDANDGVRQSFRVLNSRLTLDYTTKKTFNKGQSMKTLDTTDILPDKPIKLIVSDVGKGTFFANLTNFCYSSSNRIENKLAKIVASTVLDERFGDKTCIVKPEELKMFQGADGGLSQVNWGGSNLESTSWAIYIDPSPFDKERLKSYLENNFKKENYSVIEKAYAVWGLTNLGEPKLNELKMLLEEAGGYRERALIALALAQAGDKETAINIYYDLLANYAYEYKPYIRIQSTQTGDKLNDQYVLDTSLALLLGNSLEKQYRDGLYAYTRDYRERIEDITLDLADIAFIRQELAKLPDKQTKISFSNLNNKIEQDLKAGGNLVIPIKREDINNFTLSILEGKAEVVTFFSIGPNAISKISTDNRLKIKRTYKNVSRSGNEIKLGDIIMVRVDFDISISNSPPGEYIITDYLPSGLTYIDNPEIYNYKPEGWVENAGNNKVQYSLYNSPWWRTNGQKYFVYYARAGFGGKYIGEPAIIQSVQERELFNATGKEIIEIKGTE